MSLRKQAKILGISPTYLSLLLNGKRPWRGNLKERYEELVNTFVNTIPETGEKEEETNLEFVSEKKLGGAGGTRTPCLFNAIEALSQMSYSPTRLDKYSKRPTGAQEQDGSDRVHSHGVAAGGARLAIRLRV